MVEGGVVDSSGADTTLVGNRKRGTRGQAAGDEASLLHDTA